MNGNVERKVNIVVEPRMEIINARGEILECVNEFCYLGDMIGVGGDVEANSIMRVKCNWKKFRELLPLLTMKGLSLHLKGSLYAACVRSVMYGSKMWNTREEDIQYVGLKVLR